MTTIDYSSVTEMPGTMASQEQVDRICHRYWAGRHCRDKDVIEVACGAGQGLGYLSEIARSLRAGDYSEENLVVARAHYKTRVSLSQFDAEDMPFEDRSANVVVLFEAIYYLQSPEKFVAECRRILRKGGQVLIATANKDLYDFNPSPYSRRYYGVVELNDLFQENGFDSKCFGAWSYGSVSVRQRVLRGVKSLAVRLGLMPRTMQGKTLLKRLVFGKLVGMPNEIREGIAPYVEPTQVPDSEPDRKHKVIYCKATLP